MITHAIRRYEEPPYVAPVHSMYPYSNNGHNYESPLNQPKQHPVGPNSPKMVYQQWLRGIMDAYKVGDYVVASTAMLPYIQHNYLRIIGYQEMHALVRHDGITGEPISLEVINGSGTRFFISPSRYTVRKEPTMIPWQIKMPANT